MNKRVLGWLLFAFIIAGGLTFFATTHPHGIEKAGEQTGYISQGHHAQKSPFPDYTIQGLDTTIANTLAGVIGVMLTFVLFIFIGRWITRKSR
jgi:hypothetical protein